MSDSDETPTPSELRAYVVDASHEGRLALLERIMSDLDILVHSDQGELTLSTVDGDVGGLAAALAGMAAILHTHVEEGHAQCPCQMVIGGKG